MALCHFYGKDRSLEGLFAKIPAKIEGVEGCYAISIPSEKFNKKSGDLNGAADDQS